MLFKDLAATKKCQLYIHYEKFQDLTHSVKSNVVLIGAFYSLCLTLTYLCKIR